MPKKEARILGLASTTSKSKIVTVGVVYRGSLWLDGIVCSRLDITAHDYTFKISRIIRATKQFSQLHAIMLSREACLNGKLSITEFHQMTRVPIVVILNSAKDGSRLSGMRKFCLLVNRKHIAVMTRGIPRDEAERLYTIGCRPGSRTPEALRVARILSERLRGWF